MRIFGSRGIGFLLLSCFLYLQLVPVGAMAQETPAGNNSNRAVDLSSLYTEGRFSFQLVAGPLFSPFLIQTDEVNLNYVQTDLRLGWMLNTPSSNGSFFRGNFEAIVQIDNSIITKGPGHYIGGVAGLLRYNLVQPGTKLVPYVQVGVGIVYTDIYKDEIGHALTGQAINFTPQGSLGLRYMAGKNWSVDLEGVFHHISNAGLNDENLGINSGGVVLGFTYFFVPRL
jgi:lipid A 3-O-deacylase